jgi:hypothetical protein
MVLPYLKRSFLYSYVYDVYVLVFFEDTGLLSSLKAYTILYISKFTTSGTRALYLA